MRMHYFNPRSPCGERRVDLKQEYGIIIISIHAPRAGSDERPCKAHLHDHISIHAPRAGSDDGDTVNVVEKIDDFNPRSPCGERPQSTAQTRRPQTHFNPRSPCGERRWYWWLRTPYSSFQSTLPVRGATRSAQRAGWYSSISIHAPRAGSDARSASGFKRLSRFQSTLPVRGATPAFRRSRSN